MAKKPDRRALRTQTALRTAFMTLLARRSYDAISVQDIVDEADVGRSTFYAHCAGKDQLLRLSLGLMRRELVEAQAAARKANPTVRFAFSLPVFEHVAAHRALYPHLIRGRGGAIFATEMRDMVLQLVRIDLGTRKTDDITAHFVTGGFMEILSWWIEKRPSLPPAEIDGHFQALAGARDCAALAPRRFAVKGS